MQDRILDHFREQAGFCDLFGSPFTARLLERIAADIAAGGPSARYVADWPGSPRADVISLRFAGALHAAALSGRAPELAAAYPAQSPDWDMDRVWPLARAILGRDEAWVRGFLASPPQTNETRRTIGLLLAFLTLAERFGTGGLDMLELGASAGLNQIWDRFRYETASWSWGAPGPVVVTTDWHGPPPPLSAPIAVRTRAACDQNPLDISEAAQRLRLRSYIWADQTDRLARFDGAVSLAIEAGVKVDRADAGDWLADRLARRASDAPTVVYHSIFLQYPTRETRARIAALMEEAGRKGPAPLAWVRLEPEATLGGPRESLRVLIDMIVWRGEGSDGVRETLGVTDGHVRFVQNERSAHDG